MLRSSIGKAQAPFLLPRSGSWVNTTNTAGGECWHALRQQSSSAHLFRNNKMAITALRVDFKKLDKRITKDVTKLREYVTKLGQDTMQEIGESPAIRTSFCDVQAPARVGLKGNRSNVSFKMRRYSLAADLGLRKTQEIQDFAELVHAEQVAPSFTLATTTTIPRASSIPSASHTGHMPSATDAFATTPIVSTPAESGHSLDISSSSNNSISMNSPVTLDDIAKMLLEQRRDTNKRFEDTNNRLDKMYQQLEQQRLNTNKRFEEQRLDISMRFDSVDRRFDELRSSMHQRFDESEKRATLADGAAAAAAHTVLMLGEPGRFSCHGVLAGADGSVVVTARHCVEDTDSKKTAKPSDPRRKTLKRCNIVSALSSTNAEWSKPELRQVWFAVDEDRDVAVLCFDRPLFPGKAVPPLRLGRIAALEDAATMTGDVKSVRKDKPKVRMWHTSRLTCNGEERAKSSFQGPGRTGHSGAGAWSWRGELVGIHSEGGIPRMLAGLPSK